MSINVFIRQPFTQSGEDDQVIIQEAMDAVKSLQQECELIFLTQPVAENSDTFKKSFEKNIGLPFTPKNFRDYRLSLIDKADLFIYIRTGLSESASFELAYNIFKAGNAPVFFAIWEQTPIKTTLIRELQDLCNIEYFTFKDPKEIRAELKKFINSHFGILSASKNFDEVGV